MCLFVIDPRDALHISACVKKLNIQICKYMDVLLYHIYNHSLEFTIESNKKENAVYLLNAAPQGHIQGSLTRRLKSLNPTIPPLPCPKITTGEGRGRGMAWYGDSWLFIALSSLTSTQKDKGQWENSAVYPSISHLFEKLYLND